MKEDLELTRANDYPADSLLHQLGRTGNAQDNELQVWDAKVQQKVKTNVVLGSGAFTTAGSFTPHDPHYKTARCTKYCFSSIT